jgi:hypothetical protein
LWGSNVHEAQPAMIRDAALERVRHHLSEGRAVILEDAVMGLEPSSPLQYTESDRGQLELGQRTWAAITAENFCTTRYWREDQVVARALAAFPGMTFWDFINA